MQPITSRCNFWICVPYSVFVLLLSLLLFLLFLLIVCDFLCIILVARIAVVET